MKRFCYGRLKKIAKNIDQKNQKEVQTGSELSREALLNRGIWPHDIWPPGF
jgi:hypothetical protein